MTMDIVERLRELAGRSRRTAAAIMEDPEEAFQAVRKATGIAIGLTIAGAATSLGLFHVNRGGRVEVFLAAALFWIGYLFAHYTATGKLIHQRSAGGSHSLGRRDRYLTGIGILLALTGATMMPLAVARGDIPGTAVAVIVGGIGYILAHYGLTGTLM